MGPVLAPLPGDTQADAGWFRSHKHEGVLFVEGLIEGPTALDQFCSTLNRDLVANTDDATLDVDGIVRWSLVAQSMIFHAARRKKARGSQLFLRGGSASLHAQSSRLGLFDRVAMIGVIGDPSPEGIAPGG